MLIPLPALHSPFWQVLADHAALATAIKTQLGTWECATIAVGGSYGGMLAAWLRYQFPHTFDGALAASAPLAGFAPTGAYDVMSADFTCASDMQAAFRQMWALRKTAAGREQLGSALHLCDPLLSEAAVEVAVGYIQQQAFVIAELDYPTPSHFIGRDLPANPANVTCALFAQALAAERAPLKGVHASAGALAGLAAVVHVATNYSGGAPGRCTKVGAASFMETLPGFIPGAWTFQRCSQVIIPYATPENVPEGGARGAFLPCSEFAPNCWDPVAFAEWCSSSYGVRPRDEAQFFGGGNLSHASNIILSNGGRDPWGAGGIHVDMAGGSLVAISIPEGAHHLDLRFSDPGDPPSVVQARAREADIIRGWVRDKAERG